MKPSWRVRALGGSLEAALRAREAVRLEGGVGRDSVLWKFRPAFFLAVRLTGRYWLLRSDLAGWRRTFTWVGGVADVVSTRALIQESYPLGARAAFEVGEGALISAGLADHNAAAQLTIPTLIELSYRGGLRWAAPVSAAQILACTALRSVAGRAPNLSVYLFQASAAIGADRLASLERARRRGDVALAAVRAEEAVASGYRAGRYAAATEVVGTDEDGHPVIPHDRITPIANYLHMTSLVAPQDSGSALSAIGPRQQKAYLRGLSTGLLDALMVWRTEANQRRPRLADQLSEPRLDFAKGDWLLTPMQQSALFEQLDALALRGGALAVSVASSGIYGSRMVLLVNGNRLVVPADLLAFRTTATNLMQAAPGAGVLWALLEMLPSQNGLPFPVGGLCALPAAVWAGWAQVSRDDEVTEASYLRRALLVAAAHTVICAMVVRNCCAERPDGHAPYSLSLFTPATMIGGAWSRLGGVERVLAVGALMSIAVAGWAAVPHRRAFAPHIFQVAVCLVSGVRFDQARTNTLVDLGEEATERLRVLRDGAATRGRLDELDLCERACREAEEAIDQGPERALSSDAPGAPDIRALHDLIRARIGDLVATDQAAEPLREFDDVLAAQRALVLDAERAGR